MTPQMKTSAYRVPLYDFIPAEADLKLELGSPLGSETVPLYARHHPEVKVKPLKYWQIPRALRTAGSLGPETDPLNNYIEDTPDAKRTPLVKLTWYIRGGAKFAIEVRCGRAFTVHRGDAYMERHSPGPESKERKALLALWRKMPSSLSPQQRKRAEDFFKKQDEATKAAFGERLDEMYTVMSLVTRPEKRGRGYGSALVASVTAKADAEGRATWLSSSNLANTAFYEQCGFVGVKDFTLGEDDPTWTKPPVVLRLMLREVGGVGVGQADVSKTEGGWR